VIIRTKSDIGIVYKFDIPSHGGRIIAMAGKTIIADNGHNGLGIGNMGGITLTARSRVKIFLTVIVTG